MKKLIIILIAAILISVSIYTVSTYTASNSKNTTTTKQNEINPSTIKIKAIDFKLKDLHGNQLSLSELKGKKIFINFWATWCPPCKAEMPEIEKIYQETKNTNLVILTIEIGEPLNVVKPFISNNKYNFKVLLDTNQSIATKYAISAIPTSYFIDINGTIISKNVGAMNIYQMRASIKALDK